MILYRVQIVILDISGIYAQINHQGYFFPTEVKQLKQQYFDKSKFEIVIL